MHHKFSPVTCASGVVTLADQLSGRQLPQAAKNFTTTVNTKKKESKVMIGGDECDEGEKAEKGTVPFKGVV